jgi:hypothetical protein
MSITFFVASYSRSFFIVQTPDTRIRLLRTRHDLISHSALDIERAHASLAISAGLAALDSIHLVAMLFRVDIVRMKNKLVADVAERNPSIGI